MKNIKQIINTQTANTKNQRGFTLLEMMVALSIGLVILLGVTKIFSANRMTYSLLEATGRLQENGQYALDYISQQIRLAGYYPNPYSVPGTPTTISTLAFGAQPPIIGTEGGAGSDTVTLAYYTTTTDCVGGAPTGGAIPAQATTLRTNTGPGVAANIAVNAITIGNGAAGRPSLLCNLVEVAEGIENMQIRYGEDTDGDGVADSFVDFDNITTISNVLTVQVALLVASVREINIERDTKTYDLLGTIISGPSDGRIRRVYNTSIKLRNRCSGMQVIVGTRPCA